MLLERQSTFDEQQRDDDEHRHQHRVQNKNADVKAQQLPIEQDRRSAWLAVLLRDCRGRRGRYDPYQHADRRHDQNPGHRKQTAHSNDRIQHRRQYQ